jgi:hypothetical protein
LLRDVTVSMICPLFPTLRMKVKHPHQNWDSRPLSGSGD